MTSSSPGTAIGIDLGTTFSVVAQVTDAGVPMVLPNAEGQPTTPSIVLFDGEHVVVGAVAREALATEPENVVQLVKRHMGSAWTFDYRGVSYRPEHISSLILRKLHADAARSAGPGLRAVITAPAYFNDTMRLAVRRAGELAGLEVLGLLSEPTSAALAFGFERRPAGTTGVVIDLGGGTFDVTVIRYEANEIRVLSTGGDAYLGGANLDKALFDLFVERFRAAQGLDLNDSDALSLEEFTQASQDWLMRANRAKHDLTAREKTSVSLQVAGLRHRLDVRREEFVAATQVLLDEMSEKLIDVVEAAGLRTSDIGVVLSVGGSTRVPAVQARIARLFPVPPDTSVRPDEAVALGAALFAARRELEEGGALSIGDETREYLERLVLTDVAAHSIGVSAFDPASGRRVMAKVLPRNTALPFEESRTLYTLRPGETQVVVPILEGEEDDPELCTRLGTVTVSGLPEGRPARQPVEVTMSLDQDGILSVRARDLATAAEAVTRIVRATSPTDANDPADAAVRTLIVD